MKPFSFSAIFAFSASAWLAGHWPAAALFALALVLLLAGAGLRRRFPRIFPALPLIGLGLALVGIGSLVLAPTLGGWVALTAFGVLGCLAALLFLTGFWDARVALLVVAVLLVGLGALALDATARTIVEQAEDIAGMRLKSPLWLLLLLAVGPIVALSWRRLTRQEFRPWLALGLRVAGVTLLAFALAEPSIKQTTRTMTVFFVVDRSHSVPAEMDGDSDKRSTRLLKFINDSIKMRGAGHERDKVGVIVFGKRPRLDFPPTDAKELKLQELPEADDGNYTDIAAALKLALASFPDGTGKRIVLVSDGNENLGNAEEQAKLAKTVGCQIDIVPLAAGQRNIEDILVERVDAPPVIELGKKVPIRVLVRSANPNVVVGKLTLRQITDKEGVLKLTVGENGLGVEVVDKKDGAEIAKVVPGTAAHRAGLEPGEKIVRIDNRDIKGAGAFDAALRDKDLGDTVLVTVHRNPNKIVGELARAEARQGLTSFEFTRPLTDEQRSYTYEAEFKPLWVEEEGKPGVPGRIIQKKLTGDRAQNNRASTHVVARGQGRILILENKAGDHAELIKRLVDLGKGTYKVVAEPVEVLGNYKERDKLAVFLSNFDCVVLANVPADRVSPEHQEVIRNNTRDQGCGLVMIGGPEGYGAGGWQKTPVEDALPVECEIRSVEAQGKGGLVMIMHACEMADGNLWQKRIAKLAVERLGPADEVGVIDFGFPGNTKWVIPMQAVGPNKKKIMGKIDGMSPGDMPDFDPALNLAHRALIDDKKDYAAKHIIIISDGDPQQADPKLVPNIHKDKISIATVGIATHGAFEDKRMTEIASWLDEKDKTKRYYKVTDPRQLPAIYIKESRLVSQSFVYRKEFTPSLLYKSGPTAKVPEMLPLLGFVRTTARQSKLAEVPIVAKLGEETFPILAHWPYGLGRSAAFTSDAGKPELWCAAWLKGAGGREGIFAAFWEQLLGFVVRQRESGQLTMETTHQEGKIRIVVSARTKDGKPDTDLQLKGGVTLPGKGDGKRQEVRFVQKNSGEYEAVVKAEEAGSYFLTAQSKKVRKEIGKDGKEVTVEEGDSVRAGVTIPYSPEFAEVESNTTLLEKIREIAGGRSYEDMDETLAEAAKSSAVFRAPEDRSRGLLPFHYWLLFLAAGLLLLDVAVRRLAFDAEQTKYKIAYYWARARGLPLPPEKARHASSRLRGKPLEAAEIIVGIGRRRDPAMAMAARRSDPVPTIPVPVAAQTDADPMAALKRAKEGALKDRKK